jgi:acetyl esterase/lipase
MSTLFPILQVLFSWLGICLSVIGLFLSVWIVIPAPIYALLPLGVGAPEVCHWLLILNAIAFTLLLAGHEYWWQYLFLGASLVACILSILPLIQLSSTQAKMEVAISETLGKNYVPVEAPLGRSHPFSLLDAFTGIQSPEIRYTPDIEFAAPDGVPLRLNLYRPPQAGTYPGIVVIHGGSWQTGSPSANADFSRYMAARGYTVWSIAYRFAPAHKFPAQLDDIRSALTFIQQHAAEYETDIDRLAMLGRSAGGHLAMLAAYQPDALPLRAVISYYGPFNLTEGYRKPPNPDPLDVRGLLRDFLGGTPEKIPEKYVQASPMSYANSQLPPTLLVHGHRDNIVELLFARQMNEYLQTAGNKAILLEIPWAEHAFDSIFNGPSNQLALYYTERFLAWALKTK